MFTEMELKVLELLIQEYSNAEISDILMIRKDTVNTHITSIYKKMGVSNRVQATVKYLSMLKSAN